MTYAARGLARKPSAAWVVGLLAWFGLSLVRMVRLQCSSYNDLGIYSEALRRISFHDWNPWIPGRGVHILADHFDPILIPVALLGHGIPAPWLGIGVEFVAVALCWFPLVWLRDHGRLSDAAAVFAYGYIVLNQAMVDALHTPFHPTTWACLPLLAVFACYTLGWWWRMLVSLVVLFACREEFPLLGLTLGVVLLSERRTAVGLATLAVSGAWCLFVFGVRPLLLGPQPIAYAEGLLAGLRAHPFDLFQAELQPRMIRTFLARTVPLGLVMTWPALNHDRVRILKGLVITAPIFAVRFAADAWAFHYGTAAVIALWFVALPGLRELHAAAWRRGVAWSVLVVLFISPLLKDTWDGWFSEGRFRFGHTRCPLNRARLQRLDEAQAWIHASGRHKLLVENNLAVMQLLRTGPGQDVYIVGGPHDRQVLPFDVVLVEKSPCGDPWPNTRQRVDELIEAWRASPKVRVIQDLPQLFLAEGVIEVDR